MRKNAKLYLLSWALCFMWTKNYCLHKKLKFWMKGPDWKDQKSSSKYNPFMFSLRIIYTLCLMDKKENRLREPTNRLILILDESNWVHVRKPALIFSYRNQNGESQILFLKKPKSWNLEKILLPYCSQWQITPKNKFWAS